MKCERCGFDNPDYLEYCQNCSAPLASKTEGKQGPSWGFVKAPTWADPDFSADTVSEDDVPADFVSEAEALRRAREEARIAREEARRAQEEAEAAITATGQSDGMPRGTDVSDPTAKKAINLERDLAIINLIETEKSLMPEPYQTAVWNNIQHGMPYPLDAGATRVTFSRWKSRYVFKIAEGLKKI